MQTDEIVKLTRDVIHSVIQSRHGDNEAFGGERRRAARWPFPGTVEVHLADTNEPLFGTCCNLSETGLGMCAEEYLEPETTIEIAVHIPEISFYGQGVVRYCSRTPKGYMTGIEFCFDD